MTYMPDKAFIKMERGENGYVVHVVDHEDWSIARTFRGRTVGDVFADMLVAYGKLTQDNWEVFVYVNGKRECEEPHFTSYQTLLYALVMAEDNCVYRGRTGPLHVQATDLLDAIFENKFVEMTDVERSSWEGFDYSLKQWIWDANNSAFMHYGPGSIEILVLEQEEGYHYWYEFNMSTGLFKAREDLNVHARD